MVLSNHVVKDVSTNVDNGAIQGSFTVRALSEGCGNWSGTFSYTSHHTQNFKTSIQHFSGNVAWGSPVTTGSGTDYTVDHATAKLTYEESDTYSGCFARGEHTFSTPEFIAPSELSFLPNGKYTATIIAHTLLTINGSCPVTPLGGGPFSYTSNWSPAASTMSAGGAIQIITGDHLQGNYKVTHPTGDYEAWTWDFEPAY